MKKLLLIGCILSTLTVAAMSWELEQPQDLSKDCSDLILEMLDCLPFLSDDKNVTKPSQDCCKGMKTVLETNDKCICFALEDAPTIGFVVNMTRAGLMPALCHLNAPPISSCNISVSPEAAPSPSPGTPTPSPSPLAPAPAPVNPNPPPHSAAPTPATPPSSPVTPPVSPPSPPAAEAPESGPPTTSGAVHVQMTFLISFVVIVVSLFFV